MPVVSSLLRKQTVGLNELIQLLSKICKPYITQYVIDHPRYIMRGDTLILTIKYETEIDEITLEIKV